MTHSPLENWSGLPDARTKVMCALSLLFYGFLLSPEAKRHLRRLIDWLSEYSDVCIEILTCGNPTDFVTVWNAIADDICYDICDYVGVWGAPNDYFAVAILKSATNPPETCKRAEFPPLPGRSVVTNGDIWSETMKLFQTPKENQADVTQAQAEIASTIVNEICYLLLPCLFVAQESVRRVQGAPPSPVERLQPLVEKMEGANKSLRAKTGNGGFAELTPRDLKLQWQAGCETNFWDEEFLFNCKALDRVRVGQLWRDSKSDLE